MNGNQGDRVTFVWTWRRKRAKIEFHQFIQHHDADAVHRHTLRNPDVSLETGGLVWAVTLWILGCSPTMYSKCHACMLVCKIYNTSKAPALWKSSQVWVNSAPSRRTTQIPWFPNLQKYFSKYMNLALQFLGIWNIWNLSKYIRMQQFTQRNSKIFHCCSRHYFLLTIDMCDRGRTITCLQIPQFHTQVWYNSFFCCEEYIICLDPSCRQYLK